MAPPENEARWYSVRCVFQTPHDDTFSYEERVTLWRTQSSAHAFALAEAEAAEYAEDVSDETAETEYIGVAQCYWLTDDPGHGGEVFSLIRDSDLDADEYASQFFSTGREHQSRS